MSEREYFMREALLLAEEAARNREVPVGAVVVRNGVITGRGRNRTEEKKDPLAHAEMEAMRDAISRRLGFRLTGCEMYVTLEPCAMCAGAIVHARIARLFIGTPDPKAGACGSVMDITGNTRLNHRPEVVTGVLRDECSGILKKFFKELRSSNR